MARLPSDPNPVYTVKGYISNVPQGGWDGKSWNSRMWAAAVEEGS